MAYEICVGAVGAGLFVLHRCDNPPCVNPAHLFVGTQADNVADQLAKGRHRVVNRKLSEKDVREIRIASAGLAAMALKFGVSEAAVRRARDGTTFKWVV